MADRRAQRPLGRIPRVANASVQAWSGSGCGADTWSGSQMTRPNMVFARRAPWNFLAKHTLEMCTSIVLNRNAPLQTYTSARLQWTTKTGVSICGELSRAPSTW